MFLDNGNGTFTESDSDSTPDMNWSIAAGDLNGDGKIDLVIPNHGANTVTVFWGKGDGTFTRSSTDFATGTGPYAVTLADVDNDGKLNIVTANDASNSVSVLLNNGNKTFQTHQELRDR